MSADCDTVKFWLDAAGRYPVLRPDQVLILAQQVQSNPPESRAHKRAVQKLVRHNLKLIPRIAKRAMKSRHGKSFGGHYTEDVFQSGVIGLTRAAQLYDPKRGYAFSTYANAWIFQAIQRDLYNNMSMIRIPENTIREYYFVFKNCKTKEDLEDIDKKKLARYRDAGAAMRCLSTDFGFTKGSDNDGVLDLPSVIADPNNKDLADTVADLVSLSGTCDMSKAMVISQFETDMTISEIAQHFNVSRDRASTMIDGCLNSIKENLISI
jgi:RNA polymerase sigma factor (sigma-70 family)